MKKGYKIIRELNLVVEYYQGDLTAHDIMGNKKATTEDVDFKKDDSVVLDLRDANVQMDKNDMEKMVAFFKGNSVFQGDKKAVYLTSKPKEVANTMLFSMLVNKYRIQPQSVSTLEAAVQFLHIDGLGVERLNTIIEELKASIQTNL